MAKKEVAKKTEETKPAPAESPVESLFSPLMDLRQRMDQVFEDVMQGWQAPWRTAPFTDLPSLSRLQENLADVKFDVAESEDAVEISAELPGMDEGDVELSSSDGVLTIKGEKKTETEEKKKDYYFRERRFGSFARSFRIPDSVDEDKIKATFDKGVLDVVLPKRPEAKAKAKKISISKKK